MKTLKALAPDLICLYLYQVAAYSFMREANSNDDTSMFLWLMVSMGANWVLWSDRPRPHSTVDLPVVLLFVATVVVYGLSFSTAIASVPLLTLSLTLLTLSSVLLTLTMYAVFRPRSTN